MSRFEGADLKEVATGSSDDESGPQKQGRAVGLEGVWRGGIKAGG